MPNKTNLVVEGRITQVFEVQTIPGKNQTWQKQTFLLDIPGGNKPRTLLVELWGEDKITQYDLETELQVTCFLDLESKEHKGKWFTHAQAWKITWEAQPRRSWQPGKAPA